uniref:Uncharacterized protein n=1 Tax=viral metagenome TaxID=1070528 RepID=A0A6M3KLK6_9ZZZZ
MKKWKFTYEIEYEVDAETEIDAVNEVVYLISRDWIEYTDAGELKEVRESE